MSFPQSPKSQDPHVIVLVQNSTTRLIHRVNPTPTPHSPDTALRDSRHESMKATSTSQTQMKM